MRRVEWVRRLVSIAVLLPFVAAAAGAQQGGYVVTDHPAPPMGPMATVTGHVICSDTQKAARFASVTLAAVDESDENHGFGRRISARTDLDGNFSVQAEPGNYYVTAVVAGYVSPVSELAATLSAGASAADLLRGLPQVHVSDTGGGPVTVTLDRGGVIAGHMQWDDGTPAAGVSVAAISNATASNAGQTQNELRRVLAQLGIGLGVGGFQTTDDRGSFRLAGLAAGTYVVRATLMTPSATPTRGGFGQRMDAISLYAPGKMRRSDAQTVTLKPGEERDDLMFAIDLSALHTVSGHVAAADGGGTIESGSVQLTDSKDSTLSRRAQIQADGSFLLQWVPSGSYTLSVSNASTQAAGAGFRGGESSGAYQAFSESMTVSDSDVSDVGVSLTPAGGSQ